jgi:hypothetical protein
MTPHYGAPPCIPDPVPPPSQDWRYHVPRRIPALATGPAPGGGSVRSWLSCPPAVGPAQRHPRHATRNGPANASLFVPEAAAPGGLSSTAPHGDPDKRRGQAARPWQRKGVWPWHTLIQKRARTASQRGFPSQLCCRNKGWIQVVEAMPRLEAADLVERHFKLQQTTKLFLTQSRIVS